MESLKDGNEERQSSNEPEINKSESKIVAVTSNLKFAREIDSGGHGTVNEYLDTFSGKRFAIKQIPILGDFATDLDEVVKLYKRRYFRESDILSRLESKGLFTECFNVFVSSEVIYQNKFKHFGGASFCIQMPFDDMTIDRLVLRLRAGPVSPLYTFGKAPRTEPNKIPHGLWFISVLMQEVIDAVEIMHDNDFIHRDLKAANTCILVSFQGLQNMVKLGDFGLARHLKSKTTNAVQKSNTINTVNKTNITNIISSFNVERERAIEEASRATTINEITFAVPSTSAGITGHTRYALTSHSFGGTPLYRAPNVEEERQFRQKDDIYSLGLLYFELILKFASDPGKRELQKAIERIRNNEKLFSNYLPCLDQDVSPVISRLIEAMTDPTPEKRPTIKEVKKRNLLINYVLSFYNINLPMDKKEFVQIELEKFLRVYISEWNSQLIDHYKKVSKFYKFLLLKINNS